MPTLAVSGHQAIRNSFCFLELSEVPWHWCMYSKSKRPYLQKEREIQWVMCDLLIYKLSTFGICNVVYVSQQIKAHSSLAFAAPHRDMWQKRNRKHSPLLHQSNHIVLKETRDLRVLRMHRKPHITSCSSDLSINSCDSWFECACLVAFPVCIQQNEINVRCLCIARRIRQKCALDS